MNKKDIVRKENINKVANFIKESVDLLTIEDYGCCRYILNDKLALYVGWLDGFDMSDEDIIKAQSGRSDPTTNPYTKHTWVCGYALVCGVKVRNDIDWCDYEYLNSPIYNDDTGDVFNSEHTLESNMTIRDYRRYAKYILEDYVDIVNGLTSGKLTTI